MDRGGGGGVRAWLDRFWDGALAAFAAEVDRQTNEQKDDIP